MTIQDPQ